MQRKHNPELTFRARQLRGNMTRQERHLWYDFLRQYPVRFLRQKVIDVWIVDFYCRDAGLVLELDGSQHFEKEGLQSDSVRTKALEQYGLMVLRIPNNEIDHNFDGVCTYIDHLVKQRISSGLSGKGTSSQK